MEDGGWDSVQSVMRYAHLDVGETVAAVERLPMVQIQSSQGGVVAKQKRRQ